MEPEGSSLIDVHDQPFEIAPPDDETPYFVTLIAGLEQIAADELRERVPEAMILGASRGKLFFSSTAAPRACLELMTVENLFGYVDQIHGLPRSEEGLAIIENWSNSLDLQRAVALHHSLHGTPDSPSFRITAKRAGDHEYTSLDVAAAAGAGVVDRYGWDVDLEGYDYDIRIYVTDDTAVAGLRLTREPLHQRSRVMHGAASLNPTVAHAMCRLTSPTADEVVIDPMCGAGTLLVERARLAPPAVLAGGDLFAEPLKAAQANIDAAGVDARTLQWDARRLPLATASVDTVICNMPWGRRIGSHSINRNLYPGFVRELARVMRPQACAALLTQEKRLLTRLIGESPSLQIIQTNHLSLSGMHPAIYLVQRSS